MEMQAIPKLEVGTYNVLFVVIDSCRYDTARGSETPFLNGISSLRCAESPATYTLPAHMSFFVGILPVLLGSPEYLPGIRHIWRSNNARQNNKSVAVYFEGKTIIDYYHSNGYDVVGAGGVSFFSNAKGNILPALFPTFVHFQRPEDLSRATNLPRKGEQFPLSNIELIVSKLDLSHPFFLFINCPETHVPYDHPDALVGEEYKTAVKKLYELDGIKNVAVVEGLSEAERVLLLRAQRQSLEWIDKRLTELSLRLQNGKPILVVVMGDHGDEFGEGGRYGHAHCHPTVMHVPFWGGIINSSICRK